jgi:hypothetical protein
MRLYSQFPAPHARTRVCTADFSSNGRDLFGEKLSIVDTIVFGFAVGLKEVGFLAHELEPLFVIFEMRRPYSKLLWKRPSLIDVDL